MLCADDEVELKFGPGLTSLCEDATLEYAWFVDRGNGFQSAGTGTSLALNTGDAGAIEVTLEAITTGSAGTCVNAETAGLNIAANPVLSSFDEDLRFCEDGSLTLEVGFDVNENGGMTYNWELGDLTSFVLQGQGTPSVSLSLSEESAASDGTLGLSVLDAAGCQTSTLVAFDVLTLPVPGTASWETTPVGACSGESVSFSMEAPQLDPALDPLDYNYTWTATNDAGDVLPTLPTTDPLSDLLTGVTIPTAAWTPSLQPDQVNMALTLSDGLYSHHNPPERHPDLSLPSYLGRRRLDICAGDDWTGVLTGASSLEFTDHSQVSATRIGNASGEVLWTMPWSEIGPLHAQNDPVNFPTSFNLTAVFDFGTVTCENNWTLDVDAGQPRDGPARGCWPLRQRACARGRCLGQPQRRVGLRMDLGHGRRLQRR